MQLKENIKAPRHWPLCGEFTGDRWMPRTHGQLRGKCFHLMTSSCILTKSREIARYHFCMRQFLSKVKCKWDITLTKHDSKLAMGSVSLTVISSQFKFDRNFASLSHRFWQSDRYKIVPMARQLCCRGIGINLLSSVLQQRNHNESNFHQIWIAGKKSLPKWGNELWDAYCDSLNNLNHRLYLVAALQSFLFSAWFSVSFGSKQAASTNMKRSAHHIS